MATRRTQLVKLVNTIFFRGAGALSMLVLYRVITWAFAPSPAATLFFLITLSALATPVLLEGFNAFSVKRIAILDDAAAKARFVETTLAYFLKRRAITCAAFVAIDAAIALAWREWRIHTAEIVAITAVIPTFNLLGYFLQGSGRYNTSLFVLYSCNNALLALTIVVCQLCAFDVPVGVMYLASSALTVIVAIVLVLALFEVSPRRVAATAGTARLGRDDRAEASRFWLVYVTINVANWAPQLAYFALGASSDYSYFSVAERLANIINFFSIVPNFYLAPIIAKQHSSGELDEMRAGFARITRIVTALGLPVAAAILCFPKSLLSLFGSHYAAGAVYLLVMASAQFFNVITGAVNTVLNMTGHERQLVRSIVIAIVCEVACILVLGPWLGGIGFAIAYAVNLVVQNGVASFSVYRAFGINIFRILVGLR